MQLIKGKIKTAIKTIIYGVEGIGKSTFAAQFPDPVFIDTEGSTSHMDITRIPTPKSFSELLEDIDYFIRHPSELSTLVIDTADWAEKLAIKKICDKNSVDGIEGIPYGRGYMYVFEDMGRMLNKLQELCDKGVNIVLTSHATIRTFTPPESDQNAYDRWEMKLLASKNCDSPRMLKEWADLVLFANWKTITVKDANKKTKAHGGTERVMYTQHRVAWDAKNRFDLPEELPFSFSAIAHLFTEDARSQNAPKTPPPKVEADNVSTEEREPVNPPENPPVLENKTTSAPGYEAFEDEPHLPSELVSLFKVSEVHAHELRLVVTEKGFFPNDMMASDYPREFIDEWVIPCWDKILGRIKELRLENPFLNSDVQLPF